LVVSSTNTEGVALNKVWSVIEFWRKPQNKESVVAKYTLPGGCFVLDDRNKFPSLFSNNSSCIIELLINTFTGSRLFRSAINMLKLLL